MNTLALGLGNLAGPDLLIILSIVLILFGAKKLPALARSMGQSMNEFRKAREDIDRDLKDAVVQPSQPRSSQGGSSAERTAGHPGTAGPSRKLKNHGPPSYRTDPAHILTRMSLLFYRSRWPTE
jgi:sec-independent protein translocase protein TatA